MPSRAPSPGIFEAGFLRRAALNARTLNRHARLHAGHPRPAVVQLGKTWMAGTSPAMTDEVSAIAARICACGLSTSCPALCRASTSCSGATQQDVDGRNKSGHDGSRVSAIAARICACGLSTSCPALCRASTSCSGATQQDVDGRNKSGHDVARHCLSPRHARLYAAHPRLSSAAIQQDVDGRNKSGHDNVRGMPLVGEVPAHSLNFTPVIASRLPCQIFSLSAFGMSMPSRMRSVSRVYIVPFSGSNGQSEAKTILSRS